MIYGPHVASCTRVCVCVCTPPTHHHLYTVQSKQGEDSVAGCKQQWVGGASDGFVPLPGHVAIRGQS